MPTYILLTTLTAQGVQTLKSNPDRLREVNRDVEELGAKVLHQWATLGPFDFVNVVEAANDAAIARVSVALGARGSAKIQTVSALSIDEFLDAVTSETHRRWGTSAPAPSSSAWPFRPDLDGRLLAREQERDQARDRLGRSRRSSSPGSSSPSTSSTS